MTALPAWAEWNPGAAQAPWTVGAEEEVMLLDPLTWMLAPRIDDVLLALDPELGRHVSAETHGSALELASSVHRTAGAAARQLGAMRGALIDALAPLGLVAGAAGTHPTAVWTDTVISSGARYQSIHASMRELARREPTFALHVHVAIPTAEMAVRALTGLRAHLPLLLALSASSPYWQGRDTGMASARTPLFQAFPRVGIPRAFATYAEYVESIDVLLRCRAFPEPTFLWWDARLQPRFGTVEIRIMDVQPQARDTAALIALVQCLVRMEALEGFSAAALSQAPEVLDENRFLAARDGMHAAFVDPVAECCRPASDWLGEVLEACAPHAFALGCDAELAAVSSLAREPGADRQRHVAVASHGELTGVVRDLARAFVSNHAELAVH